MYTFAQLSKDMGYLAWALLFVCGVGFAGLFVTTTAEEKALFTSLLQCAGIAMVFFCLGAVLMKMDDRRAKWAGLLPVIFGALAVFFEVNYYYLEEFNKEHNLIGYLLSGNWQIAGELFTYAPWGAFFLAMMILYSVARSEKKKRA